MECGPMIEAVVSVFVGIVFAAILVIPVLEMLERQEEK